jgi:2,4-dienoyl-CoA reductase-like NADH-dependent reductase (Old Yellow Enzyme family)
MIEERIKIPKELYNEVYEEQDDQPVLYRISINHIQAAQGIEGLTFIEKYAERDICLPPHIPIESIPESRRKHKNIETIAGGASLAPSL